MNYSVQLKVTKKAGNQYIKCLEMAGYIAHRVTKDDWTDIHFSKNGEVSINYSVTLGPRQTFIMMRPE